MKVSEIFYSIQGEGINAGKPAIFIRLAGCNLRCTKETVGFDCDTTYAWTEGVEMSPKEVIDEIRKYDCSHVVFTGGEPTLQMTEIFRIIDILVGLGYTFEIETNGTIFFDTSRFVTVTVSPKKGCVNKKVLELFAEECLERDDIFFKFVIVDKKDVEYWLKALEDFHIPKERALFIPAGTTEQEIKERSLWLVEECKKYGVRYSPRLQIWLWGNVRGK
jgi:organic radical activating enzyme